MSVTHWLQSVDVFVLRTGTGHCGKKPFIHHFSRIGGGNSFKSCFSMVTDMPTAQLV
jgi:hypothetical protein